MGHGLPQRSLPDSLPSHRHLPAGGESTVTGAELLLSLTKAPACTKGSKRMQQRRCELLVPFPNVLCVCVHERVGVHTCTCVLPTT